MESTLAALLQGAQVYDVSFTVAADTPMFFAHGAPKIEPVMRHGVDPAATNALTVSEHTGTHVDAPLHFDEHGLAMDQVPVETLLLRPYKKFDLTGLDFAPGDLIPADALTRAGESAGITLEPGDIAILETGWDRNLPGGSAGREPGWWGRNEPGLAPDACDMLAAAGIVAVASDTAACDVAMRDGEMLSEYGHTHAFLPQGILIVEGLTGLARVPATGLFVGLPLKIDGGTGSPLRVVLIA